MMFKKLKIIKPALIEVMLIVLFVSIIMFGLKFSKMYESDKYEKKCIFGVIYLVKHSTCTVYIDENTLKPTTCKKKKDQFVYTTPKIPLKTI